MGRLLQSFGEICAEALLPDLSLFGTDNEIANAAPLHTLSVTIAGGITFDIKGF